MGGPSGTSHVLSQRDDGELEPCATPPPHGSLEFRIHREKLPPGVVGIRRAQARGVMLTW
jgi:hypothetical protein